MAGWPERTNVGPVWILVTINQSIQPKVLKPSQRRRLKWALVVVFVQGGTYDGFRGEDGKKARQGVRVLTEKVVTTDPGGSRRGGNTKVNR